MSLTPLHTNHFTCFDTVGTEAVISLFRHIATRVDVHKMLSHPRAVLHRGVTEDIENLGIAMIGITAARCGEAGEGTVHGVNLAHRPRRSDRGVRDDDRFFGWMLNR